MDSQMDFAPGGGAPSSSSLADLLQQSRKLTTHLSGARSDLPSIQLGLDQIESQSRKLALARSQAASAAVAAGNEAKAHYFLANAGIDAGNLAETINQANIAEAFEPLQPIYDTDVDSYLRHTREQVILSVIEEGRRETLNDFRRNLRRSEARDWERQKLRVFEELGQHSSSSTSASRRGEESLFRASSSSGPRGYTPSRADYSSSSNNAQIAGPNTALHSRLARYQAVVQRLNNNYRLDSTPFALAHAFADSVKTGATIAPPEAANGSAGGAATSDLVEAWIALAHVVGESDVGDNFEFKGRAIRERQYASAYLAAGDGSVAWLGAEGKDLRKGIVSGSLQFLQRHFTNYIEAKIAQNPVKAQLGGAPSVLDRIIAFQRVAYTDREGRWPQDMEQIRSSSHNGAVVPAWSTIFYLLLTGNSQAALKFVVDNDEALRKLDGSAGSGGFASYFKAWFDSADRRLPKVLRDRFLSEYNARFRGTSMLASSFSGADSSAIDGFKQALYKLIGRIDVNKNFPAAVTKDTETWLWCQLSMIREGSEDQSSGSELGGGAESLRDRFTLHDLGTKVAKYGEAHFDPKGARPLHYFLMLILVGQFERAVGFLYARAQYQVDAVNFAVALTYYGLLRVPPLSKTSHIDYLTSMLDPSTGAELMMIDFGKLIQRYIRLFSRADAQRALQYVYLLCLNADCAAPVGEEQTRKCHELVRALVIESRQYFELLGDVRNDGVKTPGLIEKSLGIIKLSDSREFLTNIVGAAASQSEAESRTRDAILLYNIAEDYDRVIDVVNRELGACLIEPSKPASSSAAAPSVGDGKTSSLTSVIDTVQLARSILDSYERQNHILRSISPKKLQTCKVLLKLKECFALAEQGELEKALNAIESLDLIPLRGDVVSITRKAESFKDVDEAISQNFSDVLLLTMNLLSKLHATTKESPFGEVGKAARLGEIRNKARALMLFAGMLRLRIEQSTFSQLTRLDVYLH